MILAANDIGYGGLKGIILNTETGKKVEIEIPSIASHVDVSTIELDNSFSRAKKVHRVKHEGEYYEVGDESSGNISKVMHDDYLNSSSWKIFFKALLRSYGETKIDFMVSGLPVSQFKALKSEMESVMTGQHQIGDDFSVMVERVAIIPQPLGAMATLINQKPEFKKKNFLLLDPGHHTFDWLVIKKGAIEWESSDSHHEGVDQIINKVISYIKTEKNVKVSHKEIDAALRDGSNSIDFFNEVLDLKSYIQKAVKIQLSSSIDALKNTLSDEHSIQNIVLAGGGASLYHEEIAKAFPKHEILVLEQSSMANARGYIRFADTMSRQSS